MFVSVLSAHFVLGGYGLSPQCKLGDACSDTQGGAFIQTQYRTDNIEDWGEAGADATLTTTATTTTTAGTCWVRVYGRGVGVPISSCTDNETDDAGLCYPQCPTNYSGEGPICWADCPSNFGDAGLFCDKPAPYGRGTGYFTESGCGDNCEEYGLFWYPKCDEGYYNYGCCVCSPDCPSGWADSGVSCSKPHVDRGVGTPLTCSSDQQYDAGLCYTPCEYGATGIGPVCWGGCPAGTQSCGALCVPNDQSCSQYENIAGDFTTFIMPGIEAAVGECGSNPPGGCLVNISALSGTNFPECEGWNGNAAMRRTIETFQRKHRRSRSSAKSRNVRHGRQHDKKRRGN